MIRSKPLFFALSLFCGMHTLAHAQLENKQTRGELLYTTHCIACHTTEVHWREKALVTDWNSLIDQVRRWQSTIGLGWSDEDIMEVGRYLNAVYYHFPSARKGDLGKEKSIKSVGQTDSN